MIDVNAILVGKVEPGNNVQLAQYIEDTIIGDNTSIEPFSHICNANIGANVLLDHTQDLERHRPENAVKIGK